MTVDGVVVVDKPAGITSHDVVDRVRKIFGTRKVGHGGTLDPEATGVLLVGVGRATRLLSYTQAGAKRYRAVVRFGVTTTTQDASGDVVDEHLVEFGEEELRVALVQFVGEIEQVPPMVSAVKIGGERLYRKARRGEEIAREPRKVTIFSLELVEWQPPEATLHVRCSGGTYVRTLAHDIGRSIGTGAHLLALRRTEAGGFTEADAIVLDALSEGDLRPLSDAVKELRALEVDAESARRISHGQTLSFAVQEFDEMQPVAVFHEGSLLAVYVRKNDRFVPDRVLA